MPILKAQEKRRVIDFPRSDKHPKPSHPVHTQRGWAVQFSHGWGSGLRHDKYMGRAGTQRLLTSYSPLVLQK